MLSSFLVYLIIIFIVLTLYLVIQLSSFHSLKSPSDDLLITEYLVLDRLLLGTLHCKSRRSDTSKFHACHLLYSAAEWMSYLLYPHNTYMLVREPEGQEI